MTKNKKIGLWTIALLQFNATLFFVAGVAITLLDIRIGFLRPELFADQFALQAVGLVLGVVMGWLALRMSILRANRAEEKLRHIAVGFSDLLTEYFDRWKLTRAERDVAVFMIKGMRTKEIAQMRGTSEGTIKAQTNAIYRKAGVTSHMELMSLFIDDLMSDTPMPNIKLAA
jgi:DNA-binding CsgD family transcriptional regulator